MNGSNPLKINMWTIIISAMQSPLSALKKFLVGVFLGILSLVPGVSGVVFAVFFGVYERIVEDIADIFHKIRTDFWFLMAIGIGLVVGIVIASYTIQDFIYTFPAMMLFLGMILGQLPQLWKYTLPEIKSSKGDIAALVIGILLMCALLCAYIIFGVPDEMTAESVGHGTMAIILMIFVGVIYALAHIAPGISGSTLLLAIGMLTLPMNVITSHDFVLLIPFLVGAVVGVIGFAKIVHRAVTHYRKPTYMMIFGLIIGSFFVVVEVMNIKTISGQSLGIADVALGAVTFIIGILISHLISIMSRGVSEELSVR